MRRRRSEGARISLPNQRLAWREDIKLNVRNLLNRRKIGALPWDPCGRVLFEGAVLGGSGGGVGDGLPRSCPLWNKGCYGN